MTTEAVSPRYKIQNVSPPTIENSDNKVNTENAGNEDKIQLSEQDFNKIFKFSQELTSKAVKDTNVQSDLQNGLEKLIELCKTGISKKEFEKQIKEMDAKFDAALKAKNASAEPVHLVISTIQQLNKDMGLPMGLPKDKEAVKMLLQSKIGDILNQMKGTIAPETLPEMKNTLFNLYGKFLDTNKLVDPDEFPQDVSLTNLINVLSKAINDPNLNIFLILIVLGLCKYNQASSRTLHLARDQKKVIEKQHAAQVLCNRVNELINKITPEKKATGTEDFTKELVDKMRELDISVDDKTIDEYLKGEPSDDQGGYKLTFSKLDAIKMACDQQVTMSNQMSSETQINITQLNNEAASYLSMVKMILSTLKQSMQTVFS